MFFLIISSRLSDSLFIFYLLSKDPYASIPLKSIHRF